MKGKYLLGFDVGTSESKGTITDLTGKVIATAARAHGLISPAPGFAEHDPLDWEKDFREIVPELLIKAGAVPGELMGIGISAIMAAVTFTDENFRPLRNAILYGIDTRCVAQCGELSAQIGPDLVKERFGTELTVEHFGPKILWVKENEPEIFDKTKHISFASGYLVSRLTGSHMVDKYSASAALPMLDPKTYTWDKEYCRYVCDSALLPEISESTYTIAGTVTEKAAEEFGLAAGIPVTVGTTDAGAEAVSVGVLDPGDMMLMYGSTAFLDAITGHTVKNLGPDEIPYTIDSRSALTAGMATTGSLTRWLRDEIGRDLTAVERSGGENAYRLLFREAESIPAGSDGLICLPYFQGERMPMQDPSAKGVFFGLSLRHTRGHLVRAALEGIACGIDQNVQMLREKGFNPGTVTAVGGGTKSPLWVQIVSDVCGFPQKVPEVTVGASYGDALMAGMAVGALSGPSDIADIVKVRYTVEPDPAKAVIYKKHKDIYKELYIRNRDLMHRL